MGFALGVSQKEYLLICSISELVARLEAEEQSKCVGTLLLILVNFYAHRCYLCSSLLL